MKKYLHLFSALAFCACVATPAFAAENVGVSQLGTYSPAAGELSLEYYEQGIATMRFKLPGGVPNRDASKFVTLTHNDVVISKVPVSNTKQLSFESVMDDEWVLSFFLGTSSKTKQGGSYVVNFDEGFFLMGEDKTPSTEIILNYSIPMPEMVAYPTPDASGYTYKYTELQDFTLTYPNAKAVEYNPNNGGAVLEIIDLYAKGSGEVPDDDEDVTPAESIKPEVTFEGNVVKIHLATPITNPGTYKIEGTEGIFLLTMEDGGQKLSSDVNIFYLVPNWIGFPDIDPVPGEVTYFPGVINLFLPKGQEVKLVNNMGVSYICPVDADGGVGDMKRNYVARYTASAVADDPTRVRLTNWNGASVEIEPAPGNYRLITPESLYSIKSDDNSRYVSSMTFDYTVVPYESNVRVLTPENGAKVTELKDIIIEFPEAESVIAKWTADPSWLQNDITNYCFFPSPVADNPKAARFYTTVPVTTPGEYTFTTAMNSLLVDDVAVAVSAKYTVAEETGVGTISDVTVMPEVFDIYDPQGIIVVKNGNLQILRELPAGIYIAAGRKFINK